MSTSPSSAVQPDTDFSLADIVRDALADSDEPDPARIADTVANSLPLAEARMALAFTLQDYVLRMIRIQRRRAVPVQPGTVRWDNVAELHGSGELSLLRSRVMAQGEWKFLGDCTRADVADIVAGREAEMAKAAASADRYRRLRAAMGRYKVDAVRDLPGATLNEIFDA
jgi:hypothetical protein